MEDIPLRKIFLYTCKVRLIMFKYSNNLLPVCIWRKSIQQLWKIPNTTHCNLLSSINSSVPIVINLERRCAKFIWSYLNSDNSIVKTIANSAKCGSVSNFGNKYRYLSYKYKIENHVWDSPLCKLHKCFDYVS